MKNINLLPPDLGPKGSVLKIGNAFKRLSLLLFFLLLVVGALTFGYFMFLRLEVKKMELSQETLKDSIKTLEQTEQKLYLLKDRLTKIKPLVNLPTLDAQFAYFGVLVSQNPEIGFSKIKFAADKTSLSFMVPQVGILNNFTGNLINDDQFKTVKINSITYSPGTGYFVDLETQFK